MKKRQKRKKCYKNKKKPKKRFFTFMAHISHGPADAAVSFWTNFSHENVSLKLAVFFQTVHTTSSHKNVLAV